jgi:hypothetical protein
MTRVPLSDPSALLIVAFEGWNDAGDSATTAAQMVVDQNGAPAGAWTSIPKIF